MLILLFFPLSTVISTYKHGYALSTKGRLSCDVVGNQDKKTNNKYWMESKTYCSRCD
jgi:hypothetical protein